MFPLDIGGGRPLLGGMDSADRLLRVAETYATTKNIALATLSKRLLNDGKRLPRLKAGTATITISSFDNAMRWLSDRWPADVPWPDGVERPIARADA